MSAGGRPSDYNNTEQDSAMIYGLADPVTNELRYIGWTKNPKRRRRQHLAAITGTDEKAIWTRELAANGMAPEFFCIEANPFDWEEAEQFWIEYFRVIGASLFNRHQGGRNSFRARRSRRATRGNSWSPLHRARMIIGRGSRRLKVEQAIARLAAKVGGMANAEAYLNKRLRVERQ
jgi:hypothetical protein